MKFSQLLVSLFIIIIFTSNGYSQGKLDKLKLERYNLQYTGNYKKALDVSNDIVNLIDKKYKHKHFKLDKTMEIVNQAELMRLLGKDKGEINGRGILAYTIATGTFGESSWEATQIKLAHLNTLIKYGELISIQKEIDKITTYAKTNNWNELKLNEIKYCQLLYNLATGFYVEALALHDEISDHQKNKIVTHIDVIHPKKGTAKNKKLKKPFYAILQRNYSEFLQLKGKILLERGDYNTALQIFDSTSIWIKENLGKHDVSYLINKYNLGLVYNKLHMEEEANNHFEYVDSKQGVVSLDLKMQPTAEVIIDVTFNLAKFYTLDDPSATIGELLFLKTKRKLASYNKGNEKEPINRLLKASSYYYQHNYKRAIEVYEYIKQDYFDQTKDSPLAIDFLEQGLQFYTALDKKKKIILTLNELTKLYTKFYPQNCPKRDLFNVRKAIYNSKYSNNFDVSLIQLEEALKSSLSYQLHTQSLEYLEIIDNIAMSQVLIEDFQEAIKTLKLGVNSSKSFSEVNGTHFLEAVYTMKVASVYFDIGYIDNFLEYYNKADTLLNQIKDQNRKEDINRSDQLALGAKYQILTGNLEDAEKSLEDAYKITHKELKKFKMDPKGYGNFEELIILDIKKGEYTDAEEKIFTTLNLKEKIYGKDSRRLISILSRLSELYLVKGDFANSSKTINRNLDIARSNYGKKSLTYAQVLSYKGRLLNDLGDYRGAINAFNETLKIYTEMFPKDHILTAKILSLKGLAMMHSEKFKANETHKILIKASKMTENVLKTRKSPAFAESIQNLALFSIKNNKLDQAEKMLALATSIWENLPGIDKVNINTAAILILEGDIFKSKKEYDQAKTKYNKGKNYYENIFNNKHPNYIYALSKLSKIYFIQDDEKNVRISIDEIAQHHIDFIREYFPSLNERDKTKYWQIINTDFEFYNNIAFKYNDEKYIQNAYNYALITKALLLNSSIKVRKNILNSNDSTLISRFKLYTRKKEKLASILSKSSESLRQKGIDKDHLIKEINDLEVELSERSEYFNKKQKKTQELLWKDIQKNLEEKEYAIEILRYRTFEIDFTDKIQYTALLISPETKKTPQIVHFANGNDLEDKHIHYYKNTTKFKSFDNESYKYFWEPIHKVVGDSSTIYLSADGVFNQINLEALAVTKNEYVIDKNNIVLVNNTKSVIDIKKEELSNLDINYYACLIGNPNFYAANEKSKDHINLDFHQSTKQLLGTEKEINSIDPILKKNNWETEKYIFNDASEETIKKISNPRVLHFASHGFFIDHKTTNASNSSLDSKRSLENPLLRSGMLLKYAGDIIENLDPHDYNTKDGILTAYEAMNMNLDKTEIVILSACETGLGKVHNGEGVYGLQRAFLVAGAKSVIMSLFKVDDLITEKLMVSFYHHWNKTNDKRRAFQLAKNEIRMQHPQPIYWGAFVMIGI